MELVVNWNKILNIKPAIVIIEKFIKKINDSKRFKHLDD